MTLILKICISDRHIDDSFERKIVTCCIHETSWIENLNEREICSLVGMRVSVGELVKPSVRRTGDLGSNPG